MSEQPTTSNRTDATPLGDGDEFRLHASQLDRLVQHASLQEAPKSPEELHYENIRAYSGNIKWARDYECATNGSMLRDEQSNYTLAA